MKENIKDWKQSLYITEARSGAKRLICYCWRTDFTAFNSREWRVINKYTEKTALTVNTHEQFIGLILYRKSKQWNKTIHKMRLDDLI